MTEESEVLSKYSSLGLKRNVLSRYGKRWHLRENYRMTQEERDKLLDELYGEKDGKRETEDENGKDHGGI